MSSSATWDAAETTCAASGGHLGVVSDSAGKQLRERSRQRHLLDRVCVTTPRLANRSARMTVPTTSGSAAMVGTYTGDTDEWDDFDPCGISSDSDDIFGLSVTVPSVYVFSTANTSFDTVLGLYERCGRHVGLHDLHCDSVECDGRRRAWDPLTHHSLSFGGGLHGHHGRVLWVVRQLHARLRRFDFVDGTLHAWANWEADQPDDDGSEDCAQVDASSGEWNDQSCSTSLHLRLRTTDLVRLETWPTAC